MSFSRLPLLWRVFVINATLLTIATILLALTPVTIHAPIALVEVIDLLVALAVMLTANLLLLRHTIGPIAGLAERMRTVDLLRPGPRFVESGGIEVTQLTRTFNQMLDRLEAERRASAGRVLHAQEDERRRIARGLHDEVGQVLTGVLLQLDSLTRSNQAARATDIEETKQSVRQALEEVRRIARELRPEMLEHLGLVSALTELSRKFADQSGIRVSHQFAENLPALPEAAEIALYRVAQESLTNVARHAGATRVEIALEPGERSVVLRVADDGRGLSEASASSNGHTGLRGMRERALLVGGALAIKRSSEGGVEVRLEVPAGGA
jgi:two-component system sensor histidine kinase UhpB